MARPGSAARSGLTSRQSNQPQARYGIWSNLGDTLLTPTGDAERVFMFGNSDVTAFMRVYAPAVWSYRSLSKPLAQDGHRLVQWNDVVEA